MFLCNIKNYFKIKYSKKSKAKVRNSKGSGLLAEKFKLKSL